MIRCPACNEENPPKFRLCGYCGASLAAAAAAPAPLPVRELRKTVTIVFSDLKDSTALGERIDTEALHEVKERYFSAMSAQIVRHGGKVEKYIGDAIMAVFGLPKAHEDDALRAVRAAHGMRAALDKLNEGLRQRYGVALANRTGINTGEVVANDDPTADQKLATGDAVNVAARLEQAAPVDQIYLGETTWRLVRDAVEVERVEPLALKGKRETVAAYRLVSAAGLDGNVRRLDTPLAGRDAELAALVAAWQTVRDERTVRLVTVIGDAGMGKSRLVHEMIRRHRDDAIVLRGRCLPYGDGITFWPLVEMASAHIRPDDSAEQAQARLLELTGDAGVAARLATAIGLSPDPYPLNELYWAARRFLQSLAEVKPVIAVIDDIHWAEPAFLELLEHLLDAAEDSSILLLATARHELVEERPTWPDRPSATRLVLEPLSAAAAEAVITHLLGSASLPPNLVGRIVKAAEGNPLYVEQMLSMLIDSRAVQHGDEADGLAGMAGLAATGDVEGNEIIVPPTIHALLEARLDRLGREERATVEPAAVVGVRFAQPAVESLAADAVRSGVPKYLASLRDKQFIEFAEQGEAGGVDFRFHHHLIRDTVYGGMLKRARANLHVAFVRWADRINAERERGLEFEEILGYHLEQAHRYLSELGPLDEQGLAIGRDGARRLNASAYRALERGDRRAAQNLYQRTLSLVDESTPGRNRIFLEYTESLMGLGRFAEARQALDQCDAATAKVPDPRARAHSQLMRLFIDLYSGQGGEWSKGTERQVQALIPTLEALEAHAELTMAWRLLMQAYGMTCKFTLATDAAERALQHARAAGGSRHLAKIAGFLSSVAPLGAAPVGEAIEQCEQLLRGELSDREVECGVMCALAQLRSMNCELEAARAQYRIARAMLRELGQGVNAASTGMNLAEIELRGGDLADAEQEVRADYAFLEKSGETYFLSSMACLLAKLVRDQGRDEEALALTITAERASADDDVLSQAQWRSVRAPILARAGELDEAERIAKEGVELLRETEAPGFQAEMYFELAQVLYEGARCDEARQFAARASDLFQAKGDLYWVRQIEKFARSLDD